MSDAVSALMGAAFEGSVTVTEQGPQGMVTLRADLADPAVAQALAAWGARMPGPRRIEIADALAAGWMSPDELLLLCPYGGADELVARLDAALDGRHFLAANVSDARAQIRIGGSGVGDVLAKLTPADVGQLRPGDLWRTRLAQVPAAVWMPHAGAVELVCFRSVARYVFDLLKTAAKPGCDVGFLD